jgi:cathepsin L
MIGLFVCSAASVLLAPHEEKSFLAWMRSTNQLFTGSEYQLRLGVYLANSRFVRSHRGSFRVGLNKFAALTPAEYRGLQGTSRIAVPSTIVPRSAPSLPSFDWRDLGVVNGVKNQGSCGSDWAFAAIQAVESSYAILTDNLLVLSESNLVDCVTTCYGCNGGLAQEAYDYVLYYQNGQFALNYDYPYKPISSNCKFDQSKSVAKITSYITVPAGDESDLGSKLTLYGPIAAAIDGSLASFQLYETGIYDEPQCSSQDLNLAVGIVGLGTEDNVPYWIVRNAWGPDWGEVGYVRIVMNKNMCGIADTAIVPRSS